MNRWFRMYEEILDDPKVQKLPPDLFKMWVNVLALASRHGGILPSLEDCAFAFRISEESVSSAFHDLEKADLLKRKGNTVQPKGWDKRQYKSDTSTVRVKRFRERSRNIAETPSDTESDTDKKDNPLPPSGGFDEFWKLYPHKVAEESSRKAFAEALAKSSLNEILAGLRRYIAAKPQTVAWKNPAGWLSAERWKDQPASPGGKSIALVHSGPKRTFAEIKADEERARHSADPPSGLRPISSIAPTVLLPVEGTVS